MEPTNLSRKLKREEFDEESKNNEEKSLHIEKLEENSEESDEETIDVEELEIRKIMESKSAEISKKRWEIFENKEMLRFKETELELDEDEMETYAKKDRIRILKKEIEKNKKKLKDLYVHQMNLENAEYDEEDPDDVNGMIIAKREVESKINKLETDNEELKNFVTVLGNQLVEERAKILAGRAKVWKERKDFEVMKEIRKKKKEDEENGNWPGEPNYV